jgi:hypothetical protein
MIVCSPNIGKPKSLLSAAPAPPAPMTGGNKVPAESLRLVATLRMEDSGTGFS